MIINGKNITGLYIYSEDAVYERNDMVVDGTTIYVCSPKGSDSVTGEKPEDSDNFYIYLSERFETTEGYLGSVEKGELDVKAISINTLQAILNHYMTGFTSKGVIGDCITVDESGNYTIKINGGYKSLTNYINILSDIMTGEINNGIFKVSGNLPELLVYGMSDTCILRQYTTYNGETRVRVQEIIDPVSGLIYLRSIKGNETPGSFKCSVVKSYRIKEQIDKILEVYSARIEYMNKLEASLKENFRYRKISLTDNAYKVTLDKTNIGDSKVITILLVKESGGIIETGNVTVDLSYWGENRTELYYKTFSGNSNLRVAKNSEEGSYTISTDSTIRISDIIYREYYGN